MVADGATEGTPTAGPVIVESTAALAEGTASIAEARRLASDFLARAQTEFGLPVTARAMDLTQLVVSELVTNAYKYAQGPALLCLRVRGASVEIEVWDSDPVLPVARAADPGRIGQHGLEIVMAVVQKFTARREPVGKRITVSLPLLEDPLPPPSAV
jgi:anti-sigma regulatory factor (Ser/Thr protein kinase)